MSYDALQGTSLDRFLTRKKNVRRKLNAMALEFVDKSVLLVDDSIVRGTTSKEIIQMAKDVGAKRIIVASCAPPIRLVFLLLAERRSNHTVPAIQMCTVLTCLRGSSWWLTTATLNQSRQLSAQTWLYFKLSQISYLLSASLIPA